MNDVSGWDPDWEISFSVADPKRFDSDPDPDPAKQMIRIRSRIRIKIRKS